MVFPIWPLDEEANRWMEVDRFTSVKEMRRQPIKTKTKIAVFFEARGLVHHEFVPQGQKVNQEFYISLLKCMLEALQHRRPDLWASGQWTLLHDNARPHTAISVSRFLTKQNITVLQYPLYSLDLSLCFFCFHNWKNAKWTATWEYWGYSSCCDDGAHSHSERGIQQLLPGDRNHC